MTISGSLCVFLKRKKILWNIWSYMFSSIWEYSRESCCWRKGCFFLFFFHPLLSLNYYSQSTCFLSCKDLISFISFWFHQLYLWLYVLRWPRSFHIVWKYTYPLQTYCPFSLDLGFTTTILITSSLIVHTFCSHLWMLFLQFEELNVGITVFLRLGLVQLLSLPTLNTVVALLVFIQVVVNPWHIHSEKLLSMNSGTSSFFLQRLFDVCFASDFLIWVSKISIGVFAGIILRIRIGLCLVFLKQVISMNLVGSLKDLLKNIVIFWLWF